MAIFGTKKEVKAKKVSTTEEATNTSLVSQSLSHVLRHARITEKASVQQIANVYTFDVAPSATKSEIIQVIKSLYKVTPRKVAIVTVPKKNVRSARTGKKGVKSGGKKAYVYLKKGDTINS